MKHWKIELSLKGTKGGAENLLTVIMALANDIMASLNLQLVGGIVYEDTDPTQPVKVTHEEVSDG